MQGDIGWRPATDVYETEYEFIIQVDLSGMAREDIQVFLEDDFVLLKGVRSNIACPGKKHFHKMEIQVGPFQRLIQIPVPIDSGSIFTNYSNGLLEVRLKKSFDQPEKRDVEVE